ncbi:MAG TPA: Nramp family divalent metal transporter [Acetobacteraceae bacterium]|nr:Nramp family divalent metal transporter [Acetobacteraceae bacterium]
MSEVARTTLSDRTTRAVRDALAGQRGGLRTAIAVSGPAVIASVAYMDPGNFATNIQAGSAYGYGLLWVVVVANLVAMLFQAMSAKLGIVTSHNLAELCRIHFRPPVVISMWVASEIAAMATDLAEFLGGAIGLSLLLHIPLLWGMGITGAVTYGLLMLEHRGFRPIELAIGGLVLTIGICYIVELLIVPPDWAAAARHSVLPHLPDGAAATLAVGIMGATVMPHAIYLHSALTQYRVPARTNAERRQLLRFSNREVVVALTFAGIVNMAMVMMAAAAFHAGHPDVAEIGSAYHILGPLLGAGAAAAFLVSLMASGISSSTVGTMAGQIIMQGFVGFRIPLWLRRLITMAPPFFVVAMGYNATMSLVISQVVLSLVLPVPVIAMLVLSRRRAVMGEFVTGPIAFAAACAATLVVLLLNLVLLLQTFGVPVPGL